MLREFEEELIELLKDFNSRIYLGEFEDIKKISTCINDDICVLIDFESESFINYEVKEASWKIYLLTHTHSNNPTNRTNAKYKLFDSLEKIDEKLKNAHFSNGYKIVLKDLKKIHEGVSEHGYLSIYARTIKSNFLPENDFLKEE